MARPRTDRARRRLLAAALLAIPGVASAAGMRQGYGLPPGQSNTRWRIAFLSPAPPGMGPTMPGQVMDGLREKGYGNRQHYEAVRTAFAYSYGEIPGRAREVVAAEPQIIVTWGTLAVQALRAATESIPIVAAYMTDPVASGFAASFARPGRNVTGIATLSNELLAKRLELLAAIAPGARRIGYLSNPLNPADARYGPVVADLARKLGREAVTIPVGNVRELAAAFESFAGRGIAAILVGDDNALARMSGAISRMAREARIAAFQAVGAPKEFRYIDVRVDRTKPIVVPPARGAVGGYATAASEQFPRLPAFIERIMKGEDVAEIPIEQPRKFELWLDPKAAQEIGLKIPPEILLRADVVLE